MSLLLRKELRLVMPATLVICLLGWVSIFMRADESFTIMIFIGGAAGIAALGYGQEFEYGTFDLQLTAPVSRRRIWWTKLAAMFAGVFVLGLNLLLFEKALPRFGLPGAAEFTMYAAWMTLTALSVTFFVWRLKSIVGGAAVGGLWSIIYLGLAEPPIWEKLLGLVDNNLVRGSNGELIRPALVLAVAGITAAAHYRYWMRGEIQGRNGSEGGIHSWSLSRAGSGPNRRRPLLNLVVKEVRLQTPAIFVSLACVAFTLLAYAGRNLFPAGIEVYKAGIVLLTAIVPLLVGCTAFAEERSLRSLQTTATLPRAWGAIFTVKFLTSCALALLLGGLLPALVEPLFGKPQFNPTVLAIVVSTVWLIGLFAGSISTSTVKAVLFACAFAVFLFLNLQVWSRTGFLSFTSIALENLIYDLMGTFPDPASAAKSFMPLLISVASIYGCTMATLLVGYSFRFGRRPDVPKRELVSAIVVIAAVTSPLAAVLMAAFAIFQLNFR